MKKLFVLCASILSVYSVAQIKAITDQGREVVLLDNGTWKFVNESDAKTLENIVTNEHPMEKSKDATFLMRSKRVNAGLYLNPKKWKVASQSVTPYVEYYFTEPNLDKGVFAFMTTEVVQIASLKSLKDNITANIEKNVDYFRLKESEYRTVNGLKVLYLRYSANTKGMDFEYAAYYYINESGYCGVVGFSPQNQFENSFPKIQEFINGIWNTEKQVVKEEIQYSSPPPPMRVK